MPRLPFLVFSLESFSFFFFFFEFFGILLAITQLHFLFLSIWQTLIFLGWICISPWYPLILSNALSFFLTWLNTLFLWNVSYFFFSSSSSIWLDFSLDESSFLLILLNLNNLSWNLMSLVPFDESIFSHNLMKILAFTFLSLFFFFWLKSFLSWWPSIFSHSLMLSQNLISSWWIFFSSFLA